MPIARTFMCPECAHRMEVVLSAEEWNAPPPICEVCDAREMRQEFKPPAIGGSIRSRAVRLTEDIIANDYQVANFKSDGRAGGTPQVRYKDQTAATLPSAWQQGGNQLLEQAISIGRQTRRESGVDGLDILKRSLADGTQPDLIEASKRKAIKVW
jgi:hypothetical protein